MKYLMMVTLLALAACAVEATYEPPPADAIAYGSGPKPVDSDDYSVKPAAYPVYRPNRDVQPPATDVCYAEDCEKQPMLPIKVTDTWVVTHVFKDYYIIESDDYNQRQRAVCKARELMCGEKLFGVYIDKDGKVTGGWETLPGPEESFTARPIYMTPGPDKAALWPADFHFVAQSG